MFSSAAAARAATSKLFSSATLRSNVHNVQKKNICLQCNNFPPATALAASTTALVASSPSVSPLIIPAQRHSKSSLHQEEGSQGHLVTNLAISPLITPAQHSKSSLHRKQSKAQHQKSSLHRSTNYRMQRGAIFSSIVKQFVQNFFVLFLCLAEYQ